VLAGRAVPVVWAARVDRVGLAAQADRAAWVGLGVLAGPGGSRGPTGPPSVRAVQDNAPPAHKVAAVLAI
jgi:hypothetical protein